MADVTDWSELGFRHSSPMSARARVTEMPPRLERFVDDRARRLDESFVGVTNDGIVRPVFPPSPPTGHSLAPLAGAAQAFLAALSEEQLERCQQPLKSADWRTWINVHMNLFRHGVMLEELDVTGRELGLDLLRETLSARGFGQARDIMRLNELLAQITGSHDEFGEWPYFITVFGKPGPDEPWGWQIDGHHLVVNSVVVGDRLVLTPTFMGAEPCQVNQGPFAGTQVFTAEERSGLDLIRSFDDRQRQQAVLRTSIHPEDLPPELRHPFDGRMQGGAFNDNAVIPNEGVAATDLSDQQRFLLLHLIATYIGWTRDGHSQVKMEQIVHWLDETWFAWMGATGDRGPFYYRVQSPVVLIEFDHHPGVVFDNSVPSRNHIHTLVRSPNGGDYGVDLLRQHHDRYDHSHGDHRQRD